MQRSKPDPEKNQHVEVVEAVDEEEVVVVDKLNQVNLPPKKTFLVDVEAVAVEAEEEEEAPLWLLLLKMIQMVNTFLFSSFLLNNFLLFSPFLPFVFFFLVSDVV